LARVILGGGVAAQKAEEAVGIVLAGLDEDDGGSTVDGSGVDGGLDELVPVGIEGCELVIGGGPVVKDAEEDDSGVVRIDGHRDDLTDGRGGCVRLRARFVGAGAGWWSRGVS